MHKTAIATLSAALLAGCAPDSWQNLNATGFDVWLNAALVTCAPVYAGPLLITRNFQDPTWDLQTNNYYDQWLDQVSRLYYKRIPPETFIDNINNFFNAASVKSAQCLVSQLPAPEQRPSAPTGRM